MAKTVAEIDGDSSGLVSALDKGRDGMVKMEASGKKLSDQLKEVADKADMAAGSIVEKIGGPKAIAALGGAGIALGGAKMAADFFLNSVEKLFKSMGDEGMKVWEDVEKALDAISGAFAKAVLGGGSAEDMGKKLITVFNGLATIIEALVKYGFPMLKVAFDGLVFVMEKLGQVTAKDKEAFDDLKRAQDNYASAASVTAIQNLTTAYDALSTKIQGMVGDQAALGLAANDAAQAELRSMQASFLKVGNIIRDVEIRKQVEKSRKQLLQRVTDEVANMDFSYAGIGWKIERDREITERLATATGDLYSSVAKQFAAQKKDAYSFMPEALQVQYDDAEASLSMLEVKWDQLYEQYLGKDTKPPPKTGGGGPPKSAPGAAVVGEFEAKEKAARDARMAEYFAEDDELKKRTAETEAFFAPLFEKYGLIPPTLGETFLALGGMVVDSFKIVKDTILGTNEEVAASTELVLTKEQEARRANFDQFVAQNAKQVAIALASGGKMADVARAAIGSVVTALGDKAFAEAGLMFATGNVAGAAGMTAAGMAAYAVATALGSNAKKAATSTAATATAPSPVTNNTSYNLQVDAAFADEESIARAFSKAQAIAKSRHMFRESVERY
jgi:hypothetical protein